MAAEAKKTATEPEKPGGGSEGVQAGDVVWYRGDEGMYVDGHVMAVAANRSMYSIATYSSNCNTAPSET